MLGARYTILYLILL